MKPLHTRHSKSIVLAILLCAGCSDHPPEIVAQKPLQNAAKKQQHDYLVGLWYEHQPTTEGGSRQELCERKSDGTYQVWFRRKSADGRIVESRETGEWGVSGAVYFTIFKGWLHGDQFEPTSNTNLSRYDAYHIVKLDASSFEYVNAETGNHFVATKVDKDFVLPPID